MGKMLTEQKVLKKLGISDFRHLTKEKVISMASMLDKMDPEVAKKALEQFPDFANTMKEVLGDYKESLDKVLAENGDSVKSYYATCDAIISSLQKELEKEPLSFEERQYIIEKMLEVANLKGMKDSENKKFLAGISLLIGGGLLIALGELAAALGGKTSVALEEADDLEDV